MKVGRISKLDAHIAESSRINRQLLFLFGFGLICYGVSQLSALIPFEKILIGSLCIICGFILIRGSFARILFQSGIIHGQKPPPEA